GRWPFSVFARVLRHFCDDLQIIDDDRHRLRLRNSREPTDCVMKCAATGEWPSPAECAAGFQYHCPAQPPATGRRGRRDPQHLELSRPNALGAPAGCRACCRGSMAVVSRTCTEFPAAKDSLTAWHATACPPRKRTQGSR